MNIFFKSRRFDFILVRRRNEQTEIKIRRERLPPLQKLARASYSFTRFHSGPTEVTYL